MNRHSLIFSVAVVIAPAVSFRAAAELQFVNVNLQSVNTNTLHAIAYDGNSSLVAVGASSATLRTTLGTNLFSVGAWSATNVPTNGLLLKTIAFGQDRFVASGSNNVVFTSTNGGANWVSPGKVFINNTVEIDGLSFNAGSFAAARVYRFVGLLRPTGPASHCHDSPCPSPRRQSSFHCPPAPDWLRPNSRSRARSADPICPQK